MRWYHFLTWESSITSVVSLFGSTKKRNSPVTNTNVFEMKYISSQNSNSYWENFFPTRGWLFLLLKAAGEKRCGGKWNCRWRRRNQSTENDFIEFGTKIELETEEINKNIHLSGTFPLLCIFRLRLLLGSFHHTFLLFFYPHLHPDKPPEKWSLTFFTSCLLQIKNSNFYFIKIYEKRVNSPLCLKDFSFYNWKDTRY